MSTANQVAELKTLGAVPNKVNLGGQAITLEPPSAARLFAVLEAATKIPQSWQTVKDTVLETESEEQAAAGLVQMLTQTMADAVPALNLIAMTNADFKSGAVSNLTVDFWRDDVRLDEIAALCEWFVKSISVGDLLKNVLRLTGTKPTTVKPAGPESQQS